MSPVGEAGGAETLLLDVLAGLQGAGVRVALVALGDGPLAGLADGRGIPVETGPALSFRRARAVLGGVAAVRRAIASVRPDVVLASHPKGQLVTALATVGRRSVPLVTQLYDPPPNSVSTRVAALIPGLRLSITDETAAAYRALNRRLDPIVIPPGTDGARLRRDAGAGDADRVWTDAGLSGPGPRVLMMGRLQRFKGPFDLLEAAAMVSRSRPDARFLIIGPDSPVEPGLRGELASAIHAQGLSNSVALAGRLQATDLAATLAGATLLVHPAWREPFGLAVVEAMALGTPVVAYATNGPAAILRSGGGAVVPVGDTKALGATVLRALNDAEMLARWRAEAVPTARRFDIEETVSRYLELLGQAATARTPTVRRWASSIGVAPATASGVRDYGRLLEDELERRGISVARRWLDNDGDGLVGAVRVPAQLLALGLRLPRRAPVVWHYSPVPYGFRALPGPGVLVGALLRARGCRVIAIVHELAYTYRPGLDPPRARLKAYVQELALRAVVAGSSEVVVTTELRRTDLLRRGVGSAGHVHVVPVFPTIPPARCDGATAEVGDDRFIVGVPGYAGDGVQPDVLLRALPMLGSLERVRVVLLGAPGPDSADGRRWRRLASEHGVLGTLEFTGVIEAAALSRRLGESTVVVLVNEEGPSSRKTTLAAALAHGLPVVSLDGYNRWDELIDAGAVRVVPDDPIALGSALCALRGSPPERAALGATAASFARTHMSLGSAADVIVGLLGVPGSPSRGDGQSAPHTVASAGSAAG